jgi:hypothetical protein
MYKSEFFTFGVLASSLVMLAVMPLFNNNNNNTVAIAQEYDKYQDSSYSQYPTDDNKYQCRTGPFEGFFVSSVEFCKHVKFDDKNRKDTSRDNRTGTKGPPGPAGATGPQGLQGIPGSVGPQGPSGITQLNATNIYLVGNSSSAAPGDGFAGEVARCDSGDFVLNGGFNLLGSNLQNNESVTTVIDQPIVDPLGGGWLTFVSINEDPFSSTLRLNVGALCFDNPPLRP